jgi:hypothetical protein
MKRLLYLIGILMLFAACELLERPLSVEPAEERMSLASLRVGDDAILLSVTRSFSALSAQSMSDLQENAIDALFINQANVQLETAGTLVQAEKLADIPGMYLLDISQITLGDSVQISVYDSLSQESVVAKTQVMQPIVIDSVGYYRGSFATDFDTLKVYVSDPDTTQNNYFMLQLFDASDFASALTNLDSLFFDAVPQLTSERTFSDLTVKGPQILSRTAIFNSIAPDTILIGIAHIEENYFRYLDARKRNNEGAGGIFNEPIQFPGNVKGGYGYVSMHLIQYRLFIKPESN